jgi:hypothetical protein
MTDVRADVRLEGDFFRRDPGKTFRANVRDMLEGLADWMETEVRSQISGQAGSMPYYTGWSWGNTTGRVHSIGGKRWGTWARVSANTAGMGAGEAIRTKAAAASIERRWHPYRKVKSAVYRARPLITANLTEGLE